MESHRSCFDQNESLTNIKKNSQFRLKLKLTTCLPVNSRKKSDPLCVNNIDKRDVELNKKIQAI